MKKSFLITGITITVLVLGAVIFLRSNKSETVDSEVEQSREKDSQASTMPEAPVASQTGATPVATSEVSKELEESFKELPTMEDMKSLSEEEVHHTPEAVLEGGRIVGRLIDKAEKDPARREETVQFLRNCSEGDDIVTAVRAVCWKQTQTQMKNWKVFVPVSEMKIPARVRELSDQLP